MDGRDVEARTLSLCRRVASGEPGVVLDERSANVIRVAAMLARPRNERAADRLEAAAESFFARRPDTRRAADDIARRGWLLGGFPRFRALLDEGLNER